MGENPPSSESDCSCQVLKTDRYVNVQEQIQFILIWNGFHANALISLFFFQDDPHADLKMSKRAPKFEELESQHGGR